LNIQLQKVWKTSFDDRSLYVLRDKPASKKANRIDRAQNIAASQSLK